MPKIEVTTEDLRTIAGNIGIDAADILSGQKNVTNIFQNMGREFSGRIPSLMTEKMIAMEDVYRGINDTLTNYSEFLRNAANTYERIDADAGR